MYNPAYMNIQFSSFSSQKYHLSSKSERPASNGPPIPGNSLPKCSQKIPKNGFPDAREDRIN